MTFTEIVEDMEATGLLPTTASGMGDIRYIPIDRLKPNPRNPRKELGDLTELADSIRAKGVLQNLTVVPQWNEEEKAFTDYRIVIGHRRHGAAQVAGLQLLPCAIACMTEQEEFETMMVENIQRCALTPIEEAEGFQLMIDMGDTVAGVAEKTGISETTVRRRMKLAELPRDKFLQSQQRGGRMEDYLRLSQIRDEATRNKVLDAVGTPNFDNRVRDALDEQSFLDALEQFKKELHEADWCRPWAGEDVYANNDWSWWKGFDKWTRKQIKAPTDTDVAEYMFREYDREVRIYRKGPKAEKKKDAAAIRLEKLERDLGKVRKELERLSRGHMERRISFVKRFGGYTTAEHDIMEFAARAMMGGNLGYMNMKLMKELTGLQGKKEGCYEVLEQEGWDHLLFQQSAKGLFFATYCRIEGESRGFHTVSYDSKLGLSVPQYKNDGSLRLLNRCLEGLGYELSDEERQLADESHPLFGEIRKLIKDYNREKGKK